MMMQPVTFQLEESFALAPDLRSWLETWRRQNATPPLDYLLAHADDGVIWGVFENGGLKLSGDAFPELQVALEARTLQSLRLFGADGELHIWRTSDGDFGASLTLDAHQTADTFDEQHLLWGDHSAGNQGFTLLVEGDLGYRHAPPLPLASGQRAVLVVRQYVAYDTTGQAYLSGGRLVEIAPYHSGEIET